jgi:hypothetical protein
MSSGAWERFEHDPRSPQTAGLRASDRDRDVVLDVLAEAYADGRLDREEYDARSSAVATAKVLGELVPQLEDLVPASSAAVPVAGATPAATDPHTEAVRRWSRDRREALTGLVGLSLITWTIWAVTMFGGFPWPLFPMLAAGINLLRVQMQKQDVIEEHERRILEREAKALEDRQKRERDED